jgi:hypothetical protein
MCYHCRLKHIVIQMHEPHTKHYLRLRLRFRWERQTHRLHDLDDTWLLRMWCTATCESLLDHRVILVPNFHSALRVDLCEPLDHPRRRKLFVPARQVPYHVINMSESCGNIPLDSTGITLNAQSLVELGTVARIRPCGSRSSHRHVP